MKDPTTTSEPQETAMVNHSPKGKNHRATTPTAQCPPWCTVEHDPEGTARLHLRNVYSFTGDGGNTVDIKLVRYDQADGTSTGPTVVYRRRGSTDNATVLTPNEARDIGALFAQGAKESTLLADVARACFVGADLAEAA